MSGRTAAQASDSYDHRMNARLPIWMRSYERAWLRADILAGLTGLVYLVPQVLAYSGLIGLPPIAGLTTAVIALVLYAFVGGSRLLSVGPEATTALMAGLVLSPILKGHAGEQVGLTAMLTLLVGLWLGAGAIGRAGVIAQLLSKPILTGYLTGAGILMVTSQLGTVTHTVSNGDTALQQVGSFITSLPQTHWLSVAVTGASLLALLVLPLISTRIPAPLIVVLIADFLSWRFGGAAAGLQELGRIPQGLPPLSVPHVDMHVLQALILGSLGISLVAFSNIMLVARGFAEPGEEIDADRELAAAAVIHVASAFVGGYPSSASSSRSAIAKRAGQRTQLAPIVSAGGLVLVLIFAGPLFQHLPSTVLAAVVIWAAGMLIVVEDYRDLWRFRRAEYFVAVMTALGTAVFGILAGIGFAVALAAVQILAALARPHEAIQGYAVGKAGLHDIDDYPDHMTIPGLLIYRYDGPLFAYNIDDFRVRLTKAILEYDPRWILLNVEANMFVDYSACSVLRDLIDEQQARGRVVGLARLKHDLRTQLEDADIMSRIGPNAFETLPQAINAYRAANPDVAMPPIPAPGQPFDPNGPSSIG